MDGSRLRNLGADTFYMSVVDLHPLDTPILIKIIILQIEDSFIFLQVVAILVESKIYDSAAGKHRLG